MKKYEPLGKYLEGSNKQSVALTFSDIEKIIGDELPVSANQRQFWENNKNHGHGQAIAFMGAGYKVIECHLVEKYIVFEKQ